MMTKAEKKEARADIIKKAQLQQYAAKMKRLVSLLESWDDSSAISQYSAICEIKETCSRAQEDFAKLQALWAFLDR